MKGAWGMRLDTAKTGSMAVLRDYQKISLRILWASPKGLGSISL